MTTGSRRCIYFNLHSCLTSPFLNPHFYWHRCSIVDPNKDRREAVKRKTTQYLKRAEEIFITHLQDNLGKGSTHLGVRHSSWLVSFKSSHKQRLVLHTFPFYIWIHLTVCLTLLNILLLWFSNVFSVLQGYSSLRFRPIRHLSSPVEDLEMCKVVGVADKVSGVRTAGVSGNLMVMTSNYLKHFRS